MCHFTAGADVPSFSFRYAGRCSAEFLADWDKAVEQDGPVTRDVHTDAATGLRVTVEVRRFADFPAIDWVLRFENTGAEDTPILEDILPLNLSVSLPAKERLRIHTANGSSCRMDDFLPQTWELAPGGSRHVAPVGGRSSNGAFPFFNLQRLGCGAVLAVGWSGQWAADFARDEGSGRLAAGMERTRLRLHPGEAIRTPRILLAFWDGDREIDGTNLLRRILIAHYLPRIDGQLVLPPAAQCLQAYFYLTGRAGEQYERAALPRAAAIGAEAYWIDACWYGHSGEWYEEVGNWDVNPERFPQGLRPISDAARAAGMKFVLWFEPERVRAGTALTREHPEFLLPSPDDPSNLLFNLGLSEAREHLTEMISERIAEHGVDIYRQDFNFDPLAYWRAAEAPDRAGMTEIRYVEGHYAFWDELRRRHPHVWIDNCASGGRRIDLETLSRSLPLWPSDFPDVIGLAYGMGLHVGDQCINAGLARWAPLFGGGLWNFTPYGTRGEVLGGFTFGCHIDRADLAAQAEAGPAADFKDVLAAGKTLLDEDFPIEAARAAIAEWKSLRPLFLGDFYLLAPLTVAEHDWCAYQLHREDLDAGFAIFFRRHRSPFDRMVVTLEGLDPAAEYDVSLSAGYDEAPRRRMRGEAMGRLAVEIPDAPGSVLLRYALAK